MNMTTDRIERVLRNQKRLFFANIVMTALVAVGLVASTAALL
jgi:hypothetical protein